MKWCINTDIYLKLESLGLILTRVVSPLKKVGIANIYTQMTCLDTFSIREQSIEAIYKDSRLIVQVESSVNCK